MQYFRSTICPEVCIYEHCCVIVTVCLHYLFVAYSFGGLPSSVVVIYIHTHLPCMSGQYV